MKNALRRLRCRLTRRHDMIVRVWGGSVYCHRCRQWV